MPVQFKTAELREAAQKVIDAKTKAQAQYERELQTHRERHETQWRNDNFDNVRALRDWLTKCLKTYTTPTEEGLVQAVPRLRLGGYSSRARLENWLYSRTSSSPPKPLRANADPFNELPGLIELLDAHQDEFITPHQLGQLGFKSRAVGQLFRDLAVVKKIEEKKAS